MRLFNALGLVVMLITLRFLMPPVFEGLEDALTAFFHLSEEILQDPSSLTASIIPPENLIPSVEGL